MSATAAAARGAIALLSLLAAGGLVACGSSSSSTTATTSGSALAAGCRPGSAGDQTVRTSTHVFLFHVGPEESMVMPAEVKAKHLKTGEVMLGGSMAGMRFAAGTIPRHVEVHICNRATGKVVTRAMPSITLVAQSGGRPEQVPVMVMQGIESGVSDLHYGNNVPMRRGVTYVVVVRTGGERAAFRFRLPRAG